MKRYIEKPTKPREIKAIRWDMRLQTVKEIANEFNVSIDEKKYKEINFEIESKGTRIHFQYSKQWYGLIATIIWGHTRTIRTDEYICLEGERLFVCDEETLNELFERVD